MKLFSMFKKFGFPKVIKKSWLAYNCRFKQGNYFQSSELSNLRIGDRVPVLKGEGGKFGIYEVVAKHPMQGADRANWDDGIEYDLKLFKIADQPECYKLQPKS